VDLNQWLPKSKATSSAIFTAYGCIFSHVLAHRMICKACRQSRDSFTIHQVKREWLVSPSVALYAPGLVPIKGNSIVIYATLNFNHSENLDLVTWLLWLVEIFSVAKSSVNYAGISFIGMGPGLKFTFLIIGPRLMRKTRERYSK